MVAAEALSVSEPLPMWRPEVRSSRWAVCRRGVLMVGAALSVCVVVFLASQPPTAADVSASTAERNAFEAFDKEWYAVNKDPPWKQKDFTNEVCVWQHPSSWQWWHLSECFSLPCKQMGETSALIMRHESDKLRRHAHTGVGEGIRRTSLGDSKALNRWTHLMCSAV